MKLSERQWAERIATLMSKEEFSEFSDFLDSCDDIVFSGEVFDIDAENFPHKYVSASYDLANAAGWKVKKV